MSAHHEGKDSKTHEHGHSHAHGHQACKHKDEKMEENQASEYIESHSVHTKPVVFFVLGGMSYLPEVLDLARVLCATAWSPSKSLFISQLEIC